MTYYNAKKYILSAKTDVEGEFLSYLHTFCLRAFLS